MKTEDLERELRAERPEPEQDFARRLDEWAEAGFPRERGLGPRVGRAGGWAGMDRLWRKLTTIPARRVLMPAGALTTVVVVAAVAINRLPSIDGSVQATGPTTAVDDVKARSAPPPPVAGLAPAESQAQGAGAGGATAPSAGAAGADSAGFRPSPGDGVARQTENRITDASAQITLGAASDQVQEVANRVVGVADRYGGIVESSQVSREGDVAAATLQLQIPFKRLDAALADLSGLADVISRSEARSDITAQAVRARKDLAGLLEQVRRTRIALIRADSREQRLVLRSRIGSLQASADAARTRLNGVRRQGRFATVAVGVSSSGAAAGSGNGSGWGIGDALDDAGHVLEVIAGIALISLAVLLPLALVAALAALALRGGLRHRRERALDGGPQSS